MAPVRQSKPLDARHASLSTDVATFLAMLRRCVHDLGWTLDALEAEMQIDKSLISRVLNGERPLTLPFLLALPGDVGSLFAKQRAECCGLIVVAPVTGQQAVVNLVSGLFGVLTARLPERADRMVKAAIATEPR